MGKGTFQDFMTIHKQNIRVHKEKFSWYGFLATWFYSGKSPIAPGTVGSIATFPLFFIVVRFCADAWTMQCVFAILFAILLPLAWIVTEKYQSYLLQFDHKSIVIDEVLGMLLTFAISQKHAALFTVLLLRYTSISIDPYYLCFLIHLIAFRFFDIKKPLLIGMVDRNIVSSFGVLLDDIIAGIFAGLSIIAFYKISNILVSFVF